MNLFQSEAEPTLDGISLVRRALRRRLSNLHIPVHVCDDLQLILSEWGANLITHASMKPTKINVSLDMKGMTLVLSIRDNGSPYPEVLDCLSTLSPALPDPMTLENGRGLELLHTFSDGLRYATRAPEGRVENTLSFSRDLMDNRPTILVVDDDPALAKSYAAFLDANFRSLTATSLEEAQRKATTQPVDLILTDYHLEDGTGETLIGLLENDRGRLPAPLLVITGDTSVRLKEKLEERGVESIISKPVRPRELNRLVKNALGRSHRQQAFLLRHFETVYRDLRGETKDWRELGDILIEHLAAARDTGSGDAVIMTPRADATRLILVDMVGHGVSAQAGSVAFLSILRTVNALSPTLSCVEYVRTINRLMAQDLELSGLLCTFLVADVFEGGHLHLASAGHVPPIVAAGNRAYPLTVSGGLIGLAGDDDFEQVDYTLRPGECMFLMSDGLDPSGLASGDPVPDWLQRALTAFASTPEPDPAEGARRKVLLNTVNAALGPEPADDWTLLAVTRSRS